MIYWFVFAVSIWATYCAQNFIKHKVVFLLFSAIAVLLPSALAGCRSSGIGTDTLIYADQVWDMVVSCDDWKTLISLFAVGALGDIEIGYLILNFITRIFSTNLNAMYFTTNFIVVLFFYLSAYDNRKQAPMWLVMTLFFFLYYNLSLNIIRQSIAFSLTMYSFKYIEQRKWKKYIVWQLITFTMHNTAFLNLLLLPLYFIPRIKKAKRRKIWILGTYCIIPMGLFSLDKILTMSISIGIIPGKFMMYAAADSDSVINITDLTTNIGLLVILFLASLGLKRSYTRMETRANMFAKISSILISLSSFVSQHAARIAYYIAPLVNCFFIPRALFSLKQRNLALYRILLACTILLVIAYWYWLVVVRDNTETYPYRSRILGIY